MSQAGIINTQSSSPPPSVATNYVTDNGTAIPALNILNVNGASSTSSNNNGIAFIANPNGSNNLVGQLTNRIIGTAITTDGTTPVNIFTFPLGAVAGSYLFFTRIIGFDRTANLGAAISTFGGVRTTGAAGAIIGSNAGLVEEEGDITEANIAYGISGNTLILTVTGIAGHTISWKSLSEYIFTS